MAKMYRRTIRIGGKRISSPRFERKADVDAWYTEMKRRKQFSRDGVAYINSSRQTFLVFAQTFIHRRMKSYPLATWQADEQRLRDYVLPKIGELPISQITAGQIKAVLQDITDSGRAIGTRQRVRALLSTMFSSALNMDPPLVNFNPVAGIKFEERRIGKKQPSFIADADQCLDFLKKAKELGPQHFIIASILLMTGVRKSELVALTWSHVDFRFFKITINQRLEQASLTIKQGTKRGEEIGRVVPVSKELILLLQKHREASKFNKDSDFIVTRKDGRFINPRTIYDHVNDISQASGIKVTTHGLRHTFGREFAARSGNMKALQAILGHSNSQTTDLYSELSGKRLDELGEIVQWKIED